MVTFPDKTPKTACNILDITIKSQIIFTACNEPHHAVQGLQGYWLGLVFCVSRIKDSWRNISDPCAEKQQQRSSQKTHSHQQCVARPSCLKEHPGMKVSWKVMYLFRKSTLTFFLTMPKHKANIYTCSVHNYSKVGQLFTHSSFALFIFYIVKQVLHVWHFGKKIAVYTTTQTMTNIQNRDEMVWKFNITTRVTKIIMVISVIAKMCRKCSKYWNTNVNNFTK